MAYYTFITAAVQDRWNLWNVRGFMILSLCMQLILSISAPLRQKTSNRFVIFLVWSSYLMADWSALFVFGLISNSCIRNSGNNDGHVPVDVIALWAGFLLVHLGGPDTITAFSLEDNALWLRHLIGLIAQLCVFLYIFIKTLPNNRLLVPTVLMFVAGVINYGERTRALYLASLENLKTKSIEKTTVPNLTKEEETFHQIAYGLVSDIMPDLQECNKSRDLIFKYNPEETLRSIKSESNVLYELLYTKAKAATSNWGISARGISCYSTQVAFILFCLADKHGFRGVDLAITYALFVGVFVLHIANTMMSGTTALRGFHGKEIVLLAWEQGIFPFLLIVALTSVLVKLKQSSAIDYLFYRRWSEKMGSVNMLSQCFKQCGPRRGCKLGFIWNKLVRERRTSREDFDLLLWNSVCEDIKGKAAGPFVAARMRELYDTRGNRVLEESTYRELMTYIKDFEYENALLIWHIATEICINIEGEEDYVDHSNWKRKRKLSKKLSDYLMYLLVRQPKLMSAVAGISQIRYKDTCVELKFQGRRFGSQTMPKFCESIVQEYANITESSIKGNNHVHSVLKDSCGLVQLLLQRGKDNRWDAIHKVWLELLSYAAGHCRVDSHLRMLSEGGEFLTFVWMLMAFCGIRDQLPVK